VCRGAKAIADEQLLRQQRRPGGGNCVEIAPLAADLIALRDSKHPDSGLVRASRSAMNAWIEACKSDTFTGVV
jgi:hypothetical protein